MTEKYNGDRASEILHRKAITAILAQWSELAQTWRYATEHFPSDDQEEATSARVISNRAQQQLEEAAQAYREEYTNPDHMRRQQPKPYFSEV